MPNTGDDTGILWKVSVAVWTFFGGLIAWVMGRLDRKVSKEVYEEFKKGNDLQHGITHSTQKDTNKKLDQIFDKLDGKKDKD